LKSQLINIQPTEGGFIVRLRLNVSGARIGQIANILTGQDPETGRSEIERIEMYFIAGNNVTEICRL
jgi:hypothetical protein